MEKRRNGIDRPPSRRCRDYPSFSSTLLDSIYRSIDETDSRVATKEHLDRRSGRKQSIACSPEIRSCIPPVETHTNFADLSSSVQIPHPARLRPIRTIPATRLGRVIVGTHPLISSTIEDKRAKKERNERPPSSPGVRLANFVSSLFSAKSKVSAEVPCQTPSSYSRSCLSKTPGKRTVRFCPVSVIVGDDRWSPESSSELQTKAEEDEDDLFELKNLTVFGRFRDDLPVCEKTRVRGYGSVTRRMVR